MEKYHPLKSLAPRDIVARAIDAEMKKSGASCVFLDIRFKGEAFIKDRFPLIYKTCQKYGIDITQEPIPVVPAAHYQCGGVITDLNGQTSLPGLWAAGEVACTGLHGANRLASNSLLEALVVSHRASEAIQKEAKVQNTIELPSWHHGHSQDPDELVVVNHMEQEIKLLMWNYVGIVRSNKRLYRASSRLRMIAQEVQEYYWTNRVSPKIIDIRNLSMVASLIVDCAISRQESRGLHYTLDYPEADITKSGIDTMLNLP